MEITMVNCQIQVASNQAGHKVIIVIDGQSGIRVVIPLTTEAAAQISHALSGSGIIVPSLIPPPNAIRRNGGAT